MQGEELIGTRVDATMGAKGRFSFSEFIQGFDLRLRPGVHNHKIELFWFGVFGQADRKS